MKDRSTSQNLKADPTGTILNDNLERRFRPKDLPFPEILNDIRQYEGHISTDYWQSEDAVFVHPPKEGALCVILRGINIGDISGVTAAVMAPKQHGPALSMAIGISPLGKARSENWEKYMGEKYQIFPNSWGVVRVENKYLNNEGKYDILLSAEVIGRQGNDDAWATFRRFSFNIPK